MATVGVLCARGRVEEKALMAALANAGIVSAFFPPADEPLPIGARSVAPGGRPFPVPQLVVDRHPNRRIARAVLAACQTRGVPVLCAGVAASGDRLDVASILDAAGLPRPVTVLYTSEQAALESVSAMGLPATLLPLDVQAEGIALLDIDTAEAILEHREVLGGADGALGLIQAGAPAVDRLVSVIVVDGVATALAIPSGTAVPDSALRLAEGVARVLRARLIAVQISLEAGEAVVWDAQPVPEFRHALPIAGQSVAAAIARAVERRLAAMAGRNAPAGRESRVVPDTRRERVRGDVVFSA